MPLDNPEAIFPRLFPETSIEDNFWIPPAEVSVVKSTHPLGLLVDIDVRCVCVVKRGSSKN